MLAENVHHLAQLRPPEWMGLDQVALPSELGPGSARVGTDSTNVGALSTGLGPKFARSDPERTNLEQHRPMLCGVRLLWGDLGGSSMPFGIEQESELLESGYQLT